MTNKTLFSITFLLSDLTSLWYVSNKILIGMNQDFGLQLPDLLLSTLIIMLAPVLAFAWVWGVASDWEFNN